ncbi:MAG: hypothetical protein LBV16_06305 [Elusimicrobiota bacterium]|jgi:hypothetical protein|nr:hypothetical protein [Elusimicrobiota bacterium]
MLRQEDIALHSGEMPIKTIDDKGQETISKVNTDFGRDEGKTFRFTEMSAVKLEKWSFKLGIVASKINDKSKVEKMKKAQNENSAALAVLPFVINDEKNFVEYIDLFNELLYCYEIYIKHLDQYVRITPENIEQYIEEVNTLGYLRNKAMEFLDFFSQGVNAGNTQAAAQASSLKR